MEKGREEAILANIRSLMQMLRLTEEQAIKVLKIPEEEQFKYVERLNQQNSCKFRRSFETEGGSAEILLPPETITLQNISPRTPVRKKYLPKDGICMV